MKHLSHNERYSRHLSLKEFGEEGQEKLRRAKVLVIGAGGLGCPALEYLAGAGTGTIGIADHDVVSLSNLHRQLLYTTDDTGLLKATCAADRLQALNPGIVVHAHCVQIDSANALDLIRQYDMVIDGTDNFTARYVINDACVLLNRPLVFAGIYRYEGQLAVFNVTDETGKKTNYRHLFPDPPAAAEAPSCRDTGVLNVLPGIIGVMQAAETIKLITGIGAPLVNRLLTWNVLTAESYLMNIDAVDLPTGLIPENEKAFRATNYAWLCGDHSAIDEDTFDQLMKEENAVAIDVREAGETPAAEFPHIHVPLSDIRNAGYDRQLLKNRTLLLFCQSGVRSSEAAALLKETLENARIYTLAGGLKGRKQKI